MNSTRRILLLNFLLFVLLMAGGITGYYFYNNYQNYITTDNARIDGQQVAIVSPAAGFLVDWNGEVGKSYNTGDKVGTVQAPANGSTTNITSPQDVTIVQQSAVKNSFVSPGTPLAYAFNLNNLYVTANIKETNINDVKTDQEVDVYVDAFPGTVIKGKVSKIGYITANIFSLLPSSNTTGNYTKVTQVIPVTITLDSYKGLNMAPGMNVTVRIHK